MASAADEHGWYDGGDMTLAVRMLGLEARVPNDYAVFALVVVAFSFALNALSDVLNISRRHRPPPPELLRAGGYPRDKLARAQEYMVVKSQFALVCNTVSVVESLLLWWGGWLEALDVNVVRAISYPEGYEVMLGGCVFSLVLSIGSSILELPFGAYKTFVIEERFGFNKTTVRTFVTDFLLQTLLSVVLGTPLICVVIAGFDWLGADAWLPLFGVVMAFMIGINVIVPAYILPLFNKFWVLPEGPLRSEIELLARELGLSLDNVYVCDGSRRSSHSNAYFTGLFGPRRLVLFDTLFETLTPQEIIAVLGHEIGHQQMYHIPRKLVWVSVQMLINLKTLSLFLGDSRLTAAFFISHHSVYVALTVFMFFMMEPLGFALGLISSYLSRRDEYQADEYCAVHVRGGDALGKALVALSAGNLSHVDPHPIAVAMEHSHPTLLQRLRAMHATHRRLCAAQCQAQAPSVSEADLKAWLAKSERPLTNDFSGEWRFKPPVEEGSVPPPSSEAEAQEPKEPKEHAE